MESGEISTVPLTKVGCFCRSSANIGVASSVFSCRSLRSSTLRTAGSPSSCSSSLWSASQCRTSRWAPQCTTHVIRLVLMDRQSSLFLRFLDTNSFCFSHELFFFRLQSRLRISILARSREGSWKRVVDCANVHQAKVGNRPPCICVLQTVLQCRKLFQSVQSRGVAQCFCRRVLDGNAQP